MLAESVEVFFPQRAQPGSGFDAGVTGKLVVDGADCLRLRDKWGDDTVPLWPPGYELNVGGGSTRVLDARGRTVGRVGGKEITLGGGGVTVGMVKGGLLDRRTERELLQRCLGDYFLVGDYLQALGAGGTQNELPPAGGLNNPP